MGRRTGRPHGRHNGTLTFAVPPDRNISCRPSLSLMEQRLIREMHKAGWHPRALAISHGISPRTVYRYLAGGE